MVTEKKDGITICPEPQFPKRVRSVTRKAISFSDLTVPLHLAPSATNFIEYVVALLKQKLPKI